MVVRAQILKLSGWCPNDLDRSGAELHQAAQPRIVGRRDFGGLAGFPVGEMIEVYFQGALPNDSYPSPAGKPAIPMMQRFTCDQP